MSTRTPDRPRSTSRVNIFAVVVLIAIGAVFAGALILTGRAESGVVFLAITWGIAAILYFGSRYSDTITLLGDDLHDERHVHIHQRAALYSLNLLMLVIVAAFMIDIARGGTGAPYTWLAATGALSYLGTIVFLSRRN